MSRQGRLLAGQAVLSALILIVVYITLLRPEGGGSLSGVETPGGSLPTPGQADQRQGSRGDGDRAGQAGGAAVTTPGAAGTDSAPTDIPIPGIETPADGIENPVDDQYTDTLGQLRARVAAG